MVESSSLKNHTTVQSIVRIVIIIIHVICTSIIIIHVIFVIFCGSNIY